jgi:flagellin
MAAKGVAVAAENMQAAESQIRDTDMASQMVDYVKNQILMQSSTAMLAQANLKTRSVLQLLA